MGIIPDPDVYGDDCLACYPANETPKKLKVFFSGIKRGLLWAPGMPYAPNGYHDLTQDLVIPCQWKSEPLNPLVILYDARGGLGLLDATFVGGHDVFFDQTFVACISSFVNGIVGAPFNKYYGGSAIIFTPAKLAEYIEAFTPMIDPDPRMECFSIDKDVFVIRYAGKRDATNISIKFDES